MLSEVTRRHGWQCSLVENMHRQPLIIAALLSDASESCADDTRQVRVLAEYFDIESNSFDLSAIQCEYSRAKLRDLRAFIH